MIRTLSAALVAVTMAAVPAAAEKLSLPEISSYLNSLTTAKSKFTQINDDGTISTGTIYIKRPGRVRFEYDPPESALVLASGSTVAIIDSKSNQPAEQYPLNRTPLSIILAQNVDLTRARMVTGHREDGNKTVVTAQDPEHPEYGNIQMVFTGPNPELRQWLINDDSGSQTTVILGELSKGGSMPNRLFAIPTSTSDR